MRLSNSVPFSPSARSRQLLDLARRLAATCPDQLGAEIALSGSASRGLADSYSDLEINLWCDGLPSLDQRVDWLRQIGATDVSEEEDVIADGSSWTTFRYADTWVEAGWQTIADLQQNLGRVLSGTETDHELLLVAWMLRTAVPLRTNGHLTAWQRAVAEYPAGLAERLIDSATGAWVWPNWVASHWAFLERGESLALSELLVADLQAVVRIVFALNQRWEPNWKWVRAEVADLPTTPDDLLDRIDTVYLAPRLDERVTASLELILDTLALAPPSEPVWRARATIREILERRPCA